MNKFEKIINDFDRLVKDIVLSEEPKKRAIAANGIIMPPPSKSQFVTIIFFLQYDENENIATIAKNKFYQIPEATIIEALKGNLHFFVLAGIFNYLIKQEKQNLEIFKALFNNENFEYKLFSSKLTNLSLEIRTFFANATTLLLKSPEITAELLKTDIIPSDKQKIVDFAIRHNIDIPIDGFEKMKQNFSKQIVSVTEIMDKVQKITTNSPLLNETENKNINSETKEEFFSNNKIIPLSDVKKLSFQEVLSYVSESMKEMLLHPKRLVMAKIKPLKPEEKVSLLFYLTLDEDVQISEEAKKSFNELPINMIDGVLGINDLDFHVLGGILENLREKNLIDQKRFEKIIFHKSFNYGLLIGKINYFSQENIELIANNTNALMSYPSLIAEIYKSPKSLSSTSQRLLEFAFRHNMIINEIEDFEELKTEFETGISTPKDKNVEKEIDEVFDKFVDKKLKEKTVDVEKIKEELETDDNEEIKIVDETPVNTIEERKSLMRLINEMTVAQKIKLAMMGNMEARSLLIKQSSRLVVEAVVRNPMLTDQEIVRYSADKNISREVIQYIAGNRKWLRKYQVKLNIVMNPKTPLGRAMNLLETLNIKDIIMISKEKGITSALKNKAAEIIQKIEKKKEKKK